MPTGIGPGGADRRHLKLHVSAGSHLPCGHLSRAGVWRGLRNRWGANKEYSRHQREDPGVNCPIRKNRSIWDQSRILPQRWDQMSYKEDGSAARFVRFFFGSYRAISSITQLSTIAEPTNRMKQ